MRHLVWILLVGCAPVPTATPEPTVPPRSGPDYAGTCPALDEGANTFRSSEIDWSVRVELPDDPVGAPVLFAWHWLQGTENQIVAALDLDDLADERGVIVIAPRSQDRTFEWDFLRDPKGNEDLAVFTDLLACAWRQWDVDLDRVWATGMSAGGLWTSYLTMHAAEWLAATAPLSGGAMEDFYGRPSRPLPVLLTWGGEGDYAVTLDFHVANQVFSEELRKDGSLVVECDHGGGHTIPSGATELVWSFLSAHPFGAERAWADGLPDGLPAWCRVADPIQ